MRKCNLFVFGNGFDLAHNLPTTYNDFFYFLEALRVFAKGSIRALQENETIKDNLPAPIYENLLSVLAEPPHPPYIDTILDALNFCNEDKINLWHTFFKQQLESQLPDVTWIDFEKEIEYLVGLIRKKEINETYIHSISEEMGAKNFSFPPIIKDLSLKVWELASGTRNYQSRASQLEAETMLFLYKELLRYAFCFELYLRYCVAELYSDSQTSPGQIFMQRFRDANASSRLPSSKDSLILSFNYTDTCEALYEISKNNVHHIHGEVRTKEILDANMTDDDFRLKTPLVLGFNSSDGSTNFDASPHLWFEKFFQRMLHKTGLTVYEWISTKKTPSNSIKDPIETSIDAIFYGHSLDSTDKDLIQHIFKVSDSVEIYYHDESRLPTLIKNLVKIFGKGPVEQDHNSGKLKFIFSP